MPRIAEESLQRRHAAVVAVDAAGYSRLTATDEKGTLASLRPYRAGLAIFRSVLIPKGAISCDRYSHPPIGSREGLRLDKRYLVNGVKRR